MALIPRYTPGEVAPQSTFPVQDVQAQPAAFGVGLGQAMQQFGGQAEAAGQELHQRALQLQDILNQDAKDKAVTDFGRAKTALLNGDGSGSDADVNAFYNLRGKPAHDALIPTTQAVEALRDQYESSLANPRQKLLFQNDTRRMMLLDQEAMGRHAAGQLKEYLHSSAAGAVENDIYMAGSARSLDEFTNTAQDIVKLANSRSSDLGLLDPQAIQAYSVDKVSKASVAYIGAMQVKDPIGAQHALETLNSEGFVSPQDYDHLGNALRARTDPIIAEQTADKYIGQIGAGLTPKQVLGKEGEVIKAITADQSLTDTQRRMALSYAQSAIRGNYMIALGQTNDNMQGALAPLIIAPGHTPPTSMDQYLADPAANAAYQKLDDSGKLSIQRQVYANNNRAHPMTAELEVREKAIERLGTTNPSAFLELNPTELAAKEGWPVAMLGRVLGAQTAVIRQMDKDAPDSATRIMQLPPLQSLMSRSDMVKDSKGNLDEDKVNTLWARIYSHIQAHEAVFHKPPPDDEVVRYAGQLLAGGHLNPNLYSSVLRGRDANNVPQGIPDEAVIEMRDIFRTKGIYAPTQTQYSQLWRALKPSWHPVGQGQ